jgi:hypothetical protein
VQKCLEWEVAADESVCLFVDFIGCIKSTLTQEKFNN